MTTAKQARLAIAMSIMAMGLLFVQPRLACASQGSNSRRANATPIVESVSDTLAFIRWTTRNPGRTILHFCVAHYGKHPNHLDLTAESPTRINLTHPEMVFRVRMHDLEPGTTYYYKVSPKQADGVSDPATSGVSQFTTRPSDWLSAKQ